MHAANPFIIPKCPGDTIHGKKNLFGLRLLRIQQGFQIARRLVQVQNECVKHITHGSGFLEDVWFGVKFSGDESGGWRRR